MMFSLAFTAVLVGLTSGAAIAPRSPSGPAPKAVYFISSEQIPASIFALPVGPDGKLFAGTTTPYGASGPLADPVQITAISAQDSIKVVDNLLFAIHAASNTISMFNINPFEPTKLTLIGTPATTAQYPISLAVSQKNQKVCVGSGGDVAGLACASFSPLTGIGKMDALRPYFTTPNTPVSIQFNSVGDVYFSNDETAVFTSVRGNAMGFNGFFSAYPVVNGIVSYKQVTSFPAGISLLYGSVPIPGTSNIFSSDSGSGIGGALIMSVNSQLQATTQKDIKIPGQSMSCWTAISPATGTGFVSDPDLDFLTEVDLQTGAVVEQASGASLMLDIRAVGNFLYALSVGSLPNLPFEAPGVAVFDLSGGRGTAKLIQSFSVAGLNATAQGMAVFA